VLFADAFVEMRNWITEVETSHKPWKVNFVLRCGHYNLILIFFTEQHKCFIFKITEIFRRRRPCVMKMEEPTFRTRQSKLKMHIFVY
jgi:hypothetical protein